MISHSIPKPVYSDVIALKRAQQLDQSTTLRLEIVSAFVAPS